MKLDKQFWIGIGAILIAVQLYFVLSLGSKSPELSERTLQMIAVLAATTVGASLLDRIRPKLCAPIFRYLQAWHWAINAYIIFHPPYAIQCFLFPVSMGLIMIYTATLPKPSVIQAPEL